jgi:CRISPR/Cas system-associated endonuclease Cas1
MEEKGDGPQLSCPPMKFKASCSQVSKVVMMTGACNVTKPLVKETAQVGCPITVNFQIAQIDFRFAPLRTKQRKH